MNIKTLIEKSIEDDVFDWNLYNSFAEEEYRLKIENVLRDYVGKSEAEFSKPQILNLLFVLGKIRNVESLNLILSVAMEYPSNSIIMSEVLDALGNLVTNKQDLPKGLEIVSVLDGALHEFEDNTDIISSIAFVLKNMYPDKFNLDKNLVEFTISDLSEVIDEVNNKE